MINYTYTLIGNLGQGTYKERQKIKSYKEFGLLASWQSKGVKVSYITSD